MAGKFPPRYMGAVMSGQAMGGIFPSVVDIVVLAMRVKDMYVGFVCFLIATIVLVVAFLAYTGVRSANFYKFYSKLTPVSHAVSHVEGEEEEVEDRRQPEARR